MADDFGDDAGQKIFDGALATRAPAAPEGGYDLILHSNEEYRRTDRTWWILIGVGFGMTRQAEKEAAKERRANKK
jgi:hypothetical protein